jgi:hypothetical protein
MADSPKRTTGKPRRQGALKIALIPVLGLVLYSQLPGDAAPVATALPARVAAPSPVPPAVAARPSPPILATVRPVDQISSRNPFALPPALLPPAEPTNPLDEFLEAAAGENVRAATSEADRWEATRERWSRERTSIVLATPDGPVAVVGERMLRIGDEVEEGLRVVDIRADGIVLEAK